MNSVPMILTQMSDKMRELHSRIIKKCCFGFPQISIILGVETDLTKKKVNLSFQKKYQQPSPSFIYSGIL